MTVIDVPLTSYREYTEALEDVALSPYAVRASNSRGRQRPEPPDPVRTAFQRDRDRVLHSKAFRRLKHKTQVFIDPEEDHHRTRLTHTLEVAQIARTIARGLRLNEDLTEAITLAHDLGHTPFGHGGEQALEEVLREYLPDGTFRHYEQSLRVVDVLERDGQGLNLTWEVRDGILGHSKGSADLGIVAGSQMPSSLEGMCVRIADRIAYINHDIDDCTRAGLLTLQDLPQDALTVVGRTHSSRIGAMVMNVLDSSIGRPEVRMTGEILQATNALKDYMYTNVYTRESRGSVPQSRGSAPDWSNAAQSRGRIELEQGQFMLKELFRLYMGEPNLFSEDGDFHPSEFDRMPLPGRTRAVTDFVAGMTDRYLTTKFKQHFAGASLPQ
jgi:dGTPase